MAKQKRPPLRQLHKVEKENLRMLAREGDAERERDALRAENAELRAAGEAIVAAHLPMEIRAGIKILRQALKPKGEPHV